MPEASTWPGLITTAAAHRRESRPEQAALSAALRRDLGLPTDLPVVISGHQPGFWHAGILAKWIALSSLTLRVTGGAHAAWVVVDHDAAAISPLRFPRRDATGALATAEWHAAPPKLEADQRADCPLCRLPAFAPQPIDASAAATPDIARGLRAMHDSLALHHSASSAAEQAASACAALAATLRTGPAPHLLFASRLGTTGAMQHLVARMLADPAACVDAYNRAVATHQVFGLAPLAADASRKRYELPLWRVTPLDSAGTAMPRQRVYAHTLPNIDPAHLAPRALLLTGLLRAYACDLFIHGTGGGATDSDRGYDRVTEDWFASWLDLPLAPATSATATLLPDLGQPPTITEADVRVAHTRPHRARHHPALLGNAEAQAIKDRFVASIAATQDRAQRRTLYRQMHEALARAVAPAAVDALRTEARTLGDRFAAEAPLRDRTLPWPLHTRADLLALSRAINAAMDGATP